MFKSDIYMYQHFISSGFVADSDFQVVCSFCWWFGHWQLPVDYLSFGQITHNHHSVIHVNLFSRGTNKDKKTFSIKSPCEIKDI